MPEAFEYGHFVWSSLTHAIGDFTSFQTFFSRLLSFNIGFFSNTTFLPLFSVSIHVFSCNLYQPSVLAITFYSVFKWFRHFKVCCKSTVSSSGRRQIKRRIIEGFQRKCLSFLLFPRGNSLSHIPPSFFLKKNMKLRITFLFSLHK